MKRLQVGEVSIGKIDFIFRSSNLKSDVRKTLPQHFVKLFQNLFLSPGNHFEILESPELVKPHTQFEPVIPHLRILSVSYLLLGGIPGTATLIKGSSTPG